MKTDVRFLARWVRCLTTLFVVALALIFVPSIAFAEGSMVDDLYNLRDQNQANANKSIKGVHEAMQEGPPPDPQDHPWTEGELNDIRNKHANLLKANNDLAHNQREWLKTDQKILDKLDPNDPRARDLKKEMKQIADGLSETVKQQEHFRNKLAESNTAIDGFKQKNDPTYVPPPRPKKTTEAQPPQSEPVEPPKTDDGGGSTDNGLDALKQKEAEQDAATRELGRQRQSAVNKYLDDPSADNRAEAEALRQKLDGMVDDLNGIRNQVDGLEGTSRPPLHVRSAKKIAEEHKKKRDSGTNTDGTETQQGSAGGCIPPISGSEQHNPDGSDASSSYQDVAPGGGGEGAGGNGNHSGQGTRRRSQSKVGSSESHHHAAGTRRKTQSNVRSSQNHPHAAGTRRGTQSNAGSSPNHHHAAGGMSASNQQTTTQKKNRQQQRRRQGVGKAEN
ncbi:MAG: hypothetical protein QOG67_3846 [Verrucomicrobiota bacterium]|jgi:hypothetical protein